MKRVLFAVLSVLPALTGACGGGFYLVGAPEVDPANDVRVAFDSLRYVVSEHIAGERYREADLALDSLLAANPLDPALLALRAQSALEQGEIESGLSFYREALTRARFDSSGVLWSQVIGIVTPEEYLEWQTGVPEERRSAWFQAFWEKRNPDLFEDINARIAEHFRRLRHARANYSLLDPGDQIHRSAEARALTLVPSVAERRAYYLCEGSLTSGHRIPVAEWDFQKEGIDRDAFGPDTTYVALTMDLRNVDTLAARVGYNLATGLDDRGLMYLRFGPPQQVVIGATNFASPDSRNPNDPQPAHLAPSCTEVLSSLERWVYSGLGVVRFSRPADYNEQGSFSGASETVFRPMNQEHYRMTEMGLTEDAPSSPAPLEFGLWTAQFADARDTPLTTLVTITTIDTLAVSLVSSREGVHARVETGRGVISLTDLPGDYTLVAHGRAEGVLGRKRGDIVLRVFDGRPDISDVLLARAWNSSVENLDGMVRRVQRDLTFETGQTVRTYAEVYGVAPDVGGDRRYHVRYSLVRISAVTPDLLEAPWPEATRFEFDRVVSHGEARIVETLDISPQYIPEGSYLLRIEVLDVLSNRSVRGRATAFRVGR